MARVMGYYMGYDCVEITRSEWESNVYLQSIKIIQTNPLNDTAYVRRDEYEYLISKNNPYYQIQAYTNEVSRCTTGYYTPTTTYRTYTQPIEQPKKKGEKVSKQIRHQYLRKRLLERLNK